MEIELVCSSFLNNSRLWEGLIKSYENHAPCLLDRFKFTIITDSDNNFINLSRVNVFCLNKDFGWSSNLIRYLQVTKSENILVIYDDVFLKSNIKFELLDQIFQEYKSNQMTFCRFRNSPLTLKKKFSSIFNIVDKDSPYRTVLSYSRIT